MPTYTPPLKDLDFVLHEVLNVHESATPGYSDLDRDFTGAILDEAGKIARDVLMPLNAIGDKEGCTLKMASFAPLPASKKPLTLSARAAGQVLAQTPNTAAKACLMFWAWRSAKCTSPRTCHSTCTPA